MSTLRRVVDEPCMQDFDLEAWIWGDLSAQGRQRLRLILERTLEGELSESPTRQSFGDGARLGYEPYQRDPQACPERSRTGA